MVRPLRRPKRGAVLAAGLAAALLGGPALAVQISGSSPGASPAAAKAAAAVVQTRTAATAAAAVRTAGPAQAAVLLAYPAAVAAYPGVAPALAAAAQPAAAQAAAPAHPAAVTGTIRLTSAVTPATPATPAAPAAPAGSICSVPGIGDIGGLLGFCNAGSSGVPGAINNICQPSLPDPEPANAGINAMIRPPAGTGPPAKTLYNNYGVAGQFWPATGLKCSDMTSLIGNNVAGMVFDIAKSIDRVTITVYQSAAGENILGWLRNSVDRLISSLGNAIYFPYLAVVVLIGAIWLAWQGLIRKRGTRTLEGTIWMVLAAAAAIWLIGRPADFTGIGKGVSDGITQTLNVAFSRLPSPGEGACLPVQKSDPQAVQNFGFSSGNDVVDQNAGELWSVLVCKPWLDGELGTTQFATTAGAKPTIVNKYGRALLWAQAIALNEKPSAELISAKQAAYQGIAQDIQQSYPGQFPAFQGKEWTTRLEIGFAALFAAVVAGVLVLLIAVTLILLKLGFLLLLVVGPFFLLIGTHPGFGRVVALRWAELLIGVLLKTAAVALVLSILLYSYTLIMGTSDAALPWALKILMIALVTIAVFIYRRPFQHLFSAVGYGVIGSRERAETDLSRAGDTARNRTRDVAAAVPGFAAYRAARWARRNPAAAAAGSAAAARAAAAHGAAGVTDADGDAAMATGKELADASGSPGGGSGGGPPDLSHGGRPGVSARSRAWAASSSA
ncbi:MAG TPA: type IV secretion system protein, partial [Streptosporangiaceae bacterium]